MQDFMGKDGFSWFIGVVEDRNDPAKIGRVRVRVLGHHSENLTEVKTTDLPWAHVMHPVTDPSMQGLGHTPSFLTQGSWVMGFFRDNEKQQPVIMGSLPGNPEASSNNSKGFSDPRGEDSPQKPYAFAPKYGPYPSEMNSGHSTGEPDTNRLARGAASESHKSLEDRRVERFNGDPSGAGRDGDTGIPTATKPYLSNVSDEAVQETRGFWDEPHPKGIVEDANPYISSAYPYNHVFESESGHITEVDDSPGAERMFRQHMTGTFEEIHPDGSVVTKIVGDNYEIVIGSENIVIKGSQNITVEGSVRELIKGDYIQEIEGDFYQKIHKNHRVKVGAANETHKNGPGGNREEEIVGNYAYNINESVKGRIGGDVDTIIEKNESRTINGYFDGTIIGNYTIFSFNDVNITASNNMSLKTVSGIVAMSAGSNVNIRSASETKIKVGSIYKFQSVGAANITYGSTIDIKSTGIAQHQYGAAFKERIHDDTFLTKVKDKVDHSVIITSDTDDTVNGSRTSDVDVVSAITPTLP